MKYPWERTKVQKVIDVIVGFSVILVIVATAVMAVMAIGMVLPPVE